MNIVSVSHFTSCYYFGPFNIYYTQKNSAFLTCKLWGRITPLSKNPTEPFLVINCVTCNCLGHSRRDSFCQKLARYCTGKWFSPYEYELWLSEGQRPKSSQKRCFFWKKRYFSSFGPLNATNRIHKEKIKYQYNIWSVSDKNCLGYLCFRQLQGTQLTTKNCSVGFFESGVIRPQILQVKTALFFWV